MRAIRLALSHLAVLAALSLLPAAGSAQPGDADSGDVRRFIARAQIEDLIIRYTHAFDALDADGYVATFTEDAVFELGGGEVRSGHDEIRGIITERLAAERDPASLELHVVTNSLIEFVADDRARHTGYWQTIVGDLAHGFGAPAMGKYEDIVVRQNGQWLFESRKLVLPATPQ